MQEPQQKNSSWQPFLLSDFKTLLWKKRAWIFSFGGCLGGLTLFFALNSSPLYKATGSFEKKVSSRAMASLYKTGLPSSTLDTGVLESQLLFSQVVSELNLQARLTSNKQQSRLSRYLRNLRLEMASFAKANYPLGGNLVVTHHPIIADVEPALECRQISYIAPYMSIFKIVPLNAIDYQLYTHKGSLLGTFSYGETVSLESASFVILKNTLSPLDTSYTLQLFPKDKVVTALQDNLKIRAHPSDKDVLLLSFTHPNRYLAAQVINHLMMAYTRYLQEEQDQIIHNQIVYLDQRIKSADHEFLSAVSQRTAQDKWRLQEEGFFNPESELSFFSHFYGTGKSRLLEIELELQHLKNPQNEEYYSSWGDDLLGTTRQLLNAKKSLETKAIALEKQLTEHTPLFDSPLLHLIEETDQNSAQLNLELADKLHEQAIIALKGEDEKLYYLKLAQEKLANPLIELSSLQLLLQFDSISQEIILNATKLLASLEDQRYQSVQEQIRTKESLEVQRNVLKSHLERVKTTLAGQREKALLEVQRIRKRLLHLVKENIAVLDRQISLQLEKRERFLLVERENVSKQLQEIVGSIANLPEEASNRYYTDMQINKHRSMVENLTNLVETKNIALNTDKSLAKPLDYAPIPTFPQPPQLFFKTFFGFIGGLFLAAVAIPLHAIYKGMPTSLANLKGLDQKIAGELSRRKRLNEKDLDTLRHINAFLEDNHHQVTVLLTGDCPFYGEELALLLSQKQKNICMIELFLEETDKLSKGRFQQRVPVQEFTIFNWTLPKLTAVEILQSKESQELLTRLTKEYESLLVVCPIAPQALGARHFAALGKKVVALVQEAPLKALQPLFGETTIFSLIDDTV